MSLGLCYAKKGPQATSRYTYVVLLGDVFKGRVNGWNYIASIVDEKHIITGRLWNDTAMERSIPTHPVAVRLCRTQISTKCLWIELRAAR